ncbi:MAG TPA: hypothetical protein VFS43_15050 [Polyangiaceae bacterium]|nr:hypothetical protein [Polyangiaceae bacterium]
MNTSLRRARASALGRPARLTAAAAAFAALAGCDASDYDQSRVEGELGRGDFNYECISPADVACEYRCTLFTCQASATNERASVFPSRVAVGGLFALTYVHEGADASSRYRVVPASPSWVDTPAGANPSVASAAETFVAKRAGQLAFLARNQAGQVADLLHVEFVPLDHLEVNDFGAVTAAVKLSPGESINLQAYPQGVDGRSLGGALSYAWSSSDEAVAAVAVGSASDRVKIEAKAEGTATVRVAVGEVTREVSIEVGAP